MENTINMYIIYKAENVKTGEIYIGATTQSIDDRKKDHIQKSNTGANCKFHSAISTYGHHSFNWVQIDTATSTDELAQKEVKYILENKAVEEGYNSDRGGGIKKTVYQYNLDGTLNATFDDLTSAGNNINVRKQDISRACWSVNHKLGGYLWSYDYKEPFVIEPDNRKKQVVQYSLKGEEIARYFSASEASRKTGISKTCITRCCRNERDNSGGYIWNYY
ncbi:NUMOD1 domain-containing DNA-binding protein [Flavobacterium sp. UMI-01]|uniref:NUMOD1 domain-containing DNA-binding protein n=1 Tax=Flavobacterium sp. UMI-01 TaxID=1441053 RepID=UPI001C7D0311|nr:NUMOD1 domain-containing DNA-binding protein [Flavobacterium sp. UMI-01]GIZ07907.1 hypothetical protein FUMI01_06340 [Flavobacterium sp. UMI-01]